MAHVLSKLKGIPIENIRHQLELDKESHASDGLYLEHVWTNADAPDEVYFLFRVNDLTSHKQQVEEMFARMREEHPEVQLPEKIFLTDA